MLFFMMNPVKIFYYGVPVVGLLDENLTEFFRLWFYNDCTHVGGQSTEEVLGRQILSMTATTRESLTPE